MKKILINYYLVFVFVLFMVLNFVFYDFEVEGLLYTLFYDVLFILNIVFIVRNRKSVNSFWKCHKILSKLTYENVISNLKHKCA